ncbi:hypothetical protein M5K25_026452 [Dendrobium thyrsiflorum]|uniref:Endonuclease/exonuclease/phosphatase domain-containing protein n=1 Tax=Dendrobium thyrsiflorum TaxID=117978 RepID=A0ABD0TXR3_DENTH
MCKDLINSYNIKLLCILEAKVQQTMSLDPWFYNSHILFDNENCCDNFSYFTPGRIWLKWDSTHLSFSPTFISAQIIHGMLSTGSLPPLFLSMIYVANHSEDRKVLWDNLKALASDIDQPWIIMGDFNCCRFDSDKAGGNALPASRLDLASVGLFYTWFNQRINLPIHIKLDIALVNNAFLDFFPSAYYKVAAEPKKLAGVRRRRREKRREGWPSGLLRGNGGFGRRERGLRALLLGTARYPLGIPRYPLVIPRYPLGTRSVSLGTPRYPLGIPWYPSVPARYRSVPLGTQLYRVPVPSGTEFRY